MLTDRGILPRRPPNRHERRRAKRAMRQRGITPGDVARVFAGLPYVGAIPTSARPSESVIYVGVPGVLSPEQCQDVCLAVAGDSQRDRWAGIMIVSESPPRDGVIDERLLKPVPLAILECMLRSEGNHRLADKLVRWPLGRVAAVIYHGWDDVSLRGVMPVPLAPGGDA